MKIFASILAVAGLALGVSGPLRADDPSAGEPEGIMPERVVLTDSYGCIASAGRGYRFVFERAPLPEIMARIGRIFHVPTAYFGAPSRELTASIQGETVDTVLLQLVDHTDLGCILDGTVWTVREEEPAMTIPGYPGPDVAAKKETVSAAAKKSP
jgi:hypothetical protein